LQVLFTCLAIQTGIVGYVYHSTKWILNSICAFTCKQFIVE
jgi:hypothetical protein